MINTLSKLMNKMDNIPEQKDDGNRGMKNENQNK